MTQTLPLLIPRFYPRSCRHCLYPLDTIIPPFLSSWKGHFFALFFSICTIYNWKGPPRHTGWYKLGRGILQHWLHGFLAPHRHSVLQKACHWFWNTITSKSLFWSFLVPTPLHNSKTKHGWKTYGKLLHIEAHLILKSFLPLKLSTITGRDHVGSYTCGGKETRTK